MFWKVVLVALSLTDLVTARPPSQLYRFQKAYRRNRLAFTAAACVFVSMVIVLAFIFCAVSAYLTGLVGGSNDPVSGMIISTVLAGSALLLVLTGGNTVIGPVAAVMIGAAVCCALCVASDNLQDLKAVK